jgi:RNA polymerase sigma-70 factor (ECF subfamily)
MNDFSDEQLMECYQINKDGRGALALDHLYSRYAKRMINFFYYSSQNNYDRAQDLLHDLFLKVIEHKAKFNTNQPFQAWIYRIASNMCKNDFRSMSVHKKYRDHLTANTELTISDNETGEMLRACIKSLNQDQRSLIVLRFKLNLTVKEIAEIYECPEGTIKSRLFYTIKELSQLYKK